MEAPWLRCGNLCSKCLSVDRKHSKLKWPLVVMETTLLFCHESEQHFFNKMNGGKKKEKKDEQHKLVLDMEKKVWPPRATFLFITKEFEQLEWESVSLITHSNV